jgi:hypothetical protein
MISTKNTQSVQSRSRATAAALASVRAEGLTPSNAVTLRLQKYADGKISATQLRRETLKDVLSRVK